MEGSNTPIHVESYGEWKLVYEAARQGSSAAYAVEMMRDEVPMARITLSHATSKTEVVEKLRDKAHDWIAGYDSRDHTGGTDFAAL